MSTGAVKAGIIGAIVAAVLQMIALIPCIGPLVACVGLIVLAVVVGVMTVNFGATYPTATSGAVLTAGGIAGVITGFVSGLANAFFDVLRWLMGGYFTTSRVYTDYMPDAMRGMERFGWNWNWDTAVAGAERTGFASLLFANCLEILLWTIIVGVIAAVSALVYHNSRSTARMV